MPHFNRFDHYLQRWSVQVAGHSLTTATSDLLPVSLGASLGGHPAMIKITKDPAEKIGGQVMQWWAGKGAAHIYAIDPETGALLMERATGSQQLLHMALEGQDDAATACICHTLLQLHTKRPVPPPANLLPLAHSFQALALMAQRHGGVLAECAGVAGVLLSTPCDLVVLHGDAHHGNILDFGSRGWLAIDPKPAMGDRYYDYANMLCNPDLPTCNDPARMVRQLLVIRKVTELDCQRLLQWVAVQAALSAAWFFEDGLRTKAEAQLAVAQLARQLLA